MPQTDAHDREPVLNGRREGAPSIAGPARVGRVARAVGAEQRVDAMRFKEVLKRRFRRTPQDLKVEAKVAQDVVLHPTIQRRKTRQGAAEIVLCTGVEMDDFTDADLRHEVLKFGRGQGVKACLQRHFF